MADNKPIENGIQTLPLERLMEFSQVVMNVGIFDFRQDLLCYLVELVLAETKEGDYVTALHLSQLLGERLSLKSTYPLQYLEQTLSELVQDQRIICQKGENTVKHYVLSSNKREEMGENRERVIELHQAATDEFVRGIRHYHEALSIQEERMCELALYNAIGLLFAEHGKQVASLILTPGAPNSGIAHLSGFANLLQKCCTVIPASQPLKKALERRLADLFASPSEAEKKFLLNMAQTYLLAGVLNINPNLYRIGRKILSQFTILLDTNVLITLLISQNKYNKENVALLRVCSANGIKFVLSERTKTELMFLLKTSRLKYQKVPKIPEQVLPKIVELADDVFIKSYWLKLRSEPQTRWEAFADRLEQVEDLVKGMYGIIIELETRFHDEVRADPNRLVDVSIAVMEVSFLRLI